MDEQNAMTPELHSIQESLYQEITEGRNRKKTIEKLLKLIEEHPDNPQLKNYLSIAYKNSGNDAKAREVNHWIQAEHPAYVFGKLNKAAEYYEDGEFEKMTEVLGREMEIQGLYPERDVFHLAEVTGFNKIAILYFVAVDNLDAARGRLEIMEEIAPDHPDTEFAGRAMMKANMEKNLKIWEEEDKKKISVTPISDALPPQVTEAPVFANPIVHRLYEHGLYIEEALLNEILELPRKSLIADLELILKDSMCRYEYFRKLVDDSDWNEEEMSFPIHAIMLLGELRAEESLTTIFEVLRQHEDFLEFWFDDHLTSTLWEPLNYLGNKQLDALKQFVLEPGVYTYVKTAVSTAVLPIYYHQPERKVEVFQWYRGVLEFFNTSRPEDNVIDSDTIGLIICDVIDLRYDNLLPVIKDLYDKQYVPEGIAGSYRSVEKDIKKVQDYPRKKDLLNINDRYKNITSTWSGYTENDQTPADRDFSDYIDYEDIYKTEPIRTSPKTGRNDPCPCGSGKKYKKCCINKTNTQ